MQTIFISSALAVAMVASCAKNDNSADTDQAGKDLRNAQSEVSDKRKNITNNEDAIERKKRELIKGQQDLSDKEKSLEDNRQQLGSARGTLADARAAYGAAVAERLAKLDAELAGLATKTDAKSKDAAAGLHARRDLLATKLATMPGTADPSWTGYTQDVDSMFDAVEHDLRAAML